MKKPYISVVMPAYNAQLYISSAIQSILQQTYKNFELIIVDDCSTDNTWKIIKKFAEKDPRIKAVKNSKNLKFAETVNTGLQLAKGVYIARMDADDVSINNRLEKQVKYLDNHPNVGIVGGTMELIDEQDNIIGKRQYATTDTEIRKRIFYYSPFSHPLIMMRKDILDKVGYYDPAYNPAEDYELYFRIGMQAKFANLTDTLLKYRIVPNSMTTGSTKKMELLTIKIRKLYGKTAIYPMSTLDKLYNTLHLISIFILPSNLKMALFNILRNSSKL